jgi:signal transduction histidine kinase
MVVAQSRRGGRSHHGRPDQTPERVIRSQMQAMGSWKDLSRPGYIEVLRGEWDRLFDQIDELIQIVTENFKSRQFARCHDRLSHFCDSMLQEAVKPAVGETEPKIRFDITEEFALGNIVTSEHFLSDHPAEL